MVTAEDRRRAVALINLELSGRATNLAQQTPQVQQAFREIRSRPDLIEQFNRAAELAGAAKAAGFRNVQEFQQLSGFAQRKGVSVFAEERAKARQEEAEEAAKLMSTRRGENFFDIIGTPESRTQRRQVEELFGISTREGFTPIPTPTQPPSRFETISGGLRGGGVVGFGIPSGIVSDVLTRSREKLGEIRTRLVKAVSPSERRRLEREEKIVETQQQDTKKFNKDVEEFNRRFGGRELSSQEFEKASKEETKLQGRLEKLETGKVEVETELKEIKEERVVKPSEFALGNIIATGDLRSVVGVGRFPSVFKLPSKVEERAKIGLVTAPLVPIQIATGVVTDPIAIGKEIFIETPKALLEDPIGVGTEIVATGAVLAPLGVGVRGAVRGVRARIPKQPFEIKLAQLERRTLAGIERDAGVIGKPKKPVTDVQLIKIFKEIREAASFKRVPEARRIAVQRAKVAGKKVTEAERLRGISLERLDPLRKVEQEIRLEASLRKLDIRKIDIKPIQSKLALERFKQRKRVEGAVEARIDLSDIKLEETLRKTSIKKLDLKPFDIQRVALRRFKRTTKLRELTLSQLARREIIQKQTKQLRQLRKGLAIPDIRIKALERLKRKPLRKVELPSIRSLALQRFERQRIKKTAKKRLKPIKDVREFREPLKIIRIKEPPRVSEPITKEVTSGKQQLVQVMREPVVLLKPVVKRKLRRVDPIQKQLQSQLQLEKGIRQRTRLIQVAKPTRLAFFPLLRLRQRARQTTLQPQAISQLSAQASAQPSAISEAVLLKSLVIPAQRQPQKIREITQPKLLQALTEPIPEKLRFLPVRRKGKIPKKKKKKLTREVSDPFLSEGFLERNLKFAPIKIKEKDLLKEVRLREEQPFRFRRRVEVIR